MMNLLKIPMWDDDATSALDLKTSLPGSNMVTGL